MGRWERAEPAAWWAPRAGGGPAAHPPGVAPAQPDPDVEGRPRDLEAFLSGGLGSGRAESQGGPPKRREPPPLTLPPAPCGASLRTARPITDSQGGAGPVQGRHPHQAAAKLFRDFRPLKTEVFGAPAQKVLGLQSQPVGAGLWDPEHGTDRQSRITPKPPKLSPSCKENPTQHHEGWLPVAGIGPSRREQQQIPSGGANLSEPLPPSSWLLLSSHHGQTPAWPPA